MKFLVESFSSPADFYGVIIHTAGNAECSCPHWQFKLKHRKEDCKHIKEARKFLEIAQEMRAESFTITKEML